VRAGNVLRELRDPFLHALGLREAHDREDDVDETLEADDAVQAERRRAALLTAGGRAPQGAARRPPGPAEHPPCIRAKHGALSLLPAFDRPTVVRPAEPGPGRLQVNAA